MASLRLQRTWGVLLALLLIGCEGQQFGAREKGALAGGALGAGLGAIIGNQTGDSGAGIAIGSAIGALSGGLIGHQIDASEAQLDASEERIRHNESVMDENERIISELKARGADVRETKRGVVVNLPDVLFEFDSARLTGRAQSTIADIASVVGTIGDRHISVEGHTDSVGTIAYNQRLSQDRARSVSAELVHQGIPRRRIGTRGLGETDPIASNRSAAGRARNRRVEVIVEN